METDHSHTDHGLESLRQRRAELRESMSALEQALAAPAADRKSVWAERVHVASSSYRPTSENTSTSPKDPMASTTESSRQLRTCPAR